MNLRCADPDSVILVSKAVYGRLRAGRCITSDYAHDSLSHRASASVYNTSDYDHDLGPVCDTDRLPLCITSDYDHDLGPVCDTDRPPLCITSDYAHALGCYSDVSSYLESVCSGHRQCSMLVATVDSVAQPCPKDFKSYLEVAYVCAPGE